MKNKNEIHIYKVETLEFDFPHRGYALITAPSVKEKNELKSDQIHNNSVTFKCLGQTGYYFAQGKIIDLFHADFGDLEVDFSTNNNPHYYQLSDIHPDYYADTNGSHDLAWHEDQMFPKDWIVGNCVMTALKYLKRFKNKNGVEDLKKCRTYIDRLIKLESK